MARNTGVVIQEQHRVLLFRVVVPGFELCVTAFAQLTDGGGGQLYFSVLSALMTPFALAACERRMLVCID